MIKDKSPAQPLVRDKSRGQPLVDPEEVRRALGAEEVGRVAKLSGAPHALYALRNEIVRRLKSTGGRPALEGTGKRQKVPFHQGDWGELDRIAKGLSEPGQSVSPAQVASAIVHARLGWLRTSIEPRLIGEVAGLEEDRARTQKTLEDREALDVKGVVKWSRLFPGLERIWIIAPNFLDDKEQDVFDSVVYNIKKRNVYFTYFVRAEDMDENGRFRRLESSIRKQVGKTKAEKNVVGVPLGKDALLWLQTDHVIANPHRVLEAVGFQFLRQSNEPSLAFRMDNAQLGMMIQKLTPWAKTRSRRFAQLYDFKKRGKLKVVGEKATSGSLLRNARGKTVTMCYFKP